MKLFQEIIFLLMKVSKRLFNKYVKPINVTSNVYDSFEIYIEKLQKENRWKSARSIQTTLHNIFRHNNPSLEPSKELYKKHPFKFEEVTVDWLGNFDRTRRQKVSVSSLGIDREISELYIILSRLHLHILKKYLFGKNTERLYSIPTGQSKNQSLNKDQLALKKLVNTFSNLIDTKNVAKQVLQFTKDASVT